MKRAVAIVALSAMTVGFVGCASKAQTGTLIGAGGGAVVGGVIGKAAGNTAAGVIIGAAVGGAAGAIIGGYMDRQAAEMERDLEGARIERIGEGIKVTFASGILFDVDRADLRPEAQADLVKLSRIVNKYEDTNILVEGHTDATGPEDYNDQLSVRRGESVANYVVAQNVASQRLSVVGYGERQPIATNDSPDGRQQNRRVEIAIWANDKLKETASRQAQQ
jgi:outer membrane protein OmpA-like peptidoglycan-associated protein